MSARSKSCIFITGGGAGIGLATAKEFARRGWFVGVYDHDAQSAAAAVDAVGAENGCWGAMDVRDPTSIEAALEAFAAKTGGRLDVLFNNAGVLRVSPFEKIPLEQHHAHIEVNAKGVVNCTYLAFELLKATPGARVISMASASAAFGVPDFNTYSATKFFVRGLTEALNIEWKRHDIRVCDVWPPFVRTAMIAGFGGNEAVSNLGVELSAEDVARVVWEAAHGTKVHWPVSTKFKCMAALMKLVPLPATRAVMATLTGYPR